jgi:hypothetical protein
LDGSRPKLGAIVGQAALKFCFKSSILRAGSREAAQNSIRQRKFQALSHPFAYYMLMLRLVFLRAGSFWPLLRNLGEELRNRPQSASEHRPESASEHVALQYSGSRLLDVRCVPPLLHPPEILIDDLALSAPLLSRRKSAAASEFQVPCPDALSKFGAGV